MARRKAAVVAAVACGQITVEEACRRYQLSEEEFFAWQRAFEIYGVDGLQATGVRQYRGARRARRTKLKSPAATSVQQGPSTQEQEGCKNG